MKSNDLNIFMLLRNFVFSKGIYIFVVVVCLMAVTIMIVASNQASGTGYPLDDSWIHQTYARNLLNTGHWGYSLNENSAGSTSPLWTILLIPGFFFGNDNPYIWTLIISMVCYWGLLITAVSFFSIHFNFDKMDTIVFGLLLAIEWHLVWAVGSGMETILFVSLSFLILSLMLKESPNFSIIGLLIGLLVFVRPDGLTLLGPVGFVLFIKLMKKKIRLTQLVGFVVFLMIPLVLYGIHNYSLSGSVFPNTLMAKTQEYKELLQQPLFLRFLNLSTILLSGVGILVLPGFLVKIVRFIKQKDIWGLSVVCWISGFIFLYAIRLPVVYQHGRYLIPIIPAYLLLGFMGTRDLINLLPLLKQKGYRNIIFSSLVITSVIFFVSGVKAYSNDVRIINALMVQPALWINENTAPNAIIAAHDIGAIGFFSERKIVDLAGLINPEISPIIRDEEKLIDYVESSGADYLVIFSDWYQLLNQRGTRIEIFNLAIGKDVKSVEIRKLR